MAGSRVTHTTLTPSTVVILSVVVLMAAMGNQGVMAQSGCTTALVSLSPCLNYISGNQTTPSQGCCTALATVVKNNPSCLCQLLTGNNQLGIAINQTRALALPGECKVTTPPVSQCQGSGSPTTSPSPTVSEVPPTSPSVSGSGTPTTEATPSSNPTQNNSASSIFAFPVFKVLAVVVLAVVVM
ncbi:non-specific lipid transfer protein GPI-anchored 5-like [Cryptomeria japonica]|uniref:non-specific lipid transfer protein GPI-anchored 5-like n=1 Tax=Cryptomeria japonica TaxID=3369 RepID=UPI0027D9F3EA|nr:non-specific lipid transfer protein GPI-anchored 5-like [Cryptomeria japonica]